MPAWRRHVAHADRWLMTILVTGAAGFIGAHVLRRLRESGMAAVGLDSFSDYYSVRLKRDRVAALVPSAIIEPVDCTDAVALEQVFRRHNVRRVIHLAAQAGVRHSLTNPMAYIQANQVGFANVLECCRQFGVEHLVYASSSSVYGNHENLPWDENDCVAHPVSLYAATKASNELLAHAYAHLYRLPATGLRFFTVYGPWGRPDMAPMLFARAILAGEPIRVFNDGHMRRDFTYVDDIVEAVCRLVERPAEPDPAFDRRNPQPATSDAPHRIFNIGNHEPVELLDFIGTLEAALGRPAVRQMEPMQAGDVLATCAATDRLDEWIGFRPATRLQDGIAHFAQWYRGYAEQTQQQQAPQPGPQPQTRTDADAAMLAAARAHSSAGRLLGVAGAAVAAGAALHHGSLDQALFGAINSTQAAAPGLWHLLSQLGLGVSLALVLAAVCAHRPARLAAFLVALAGAGIFAQAIKYGLTLPRPLGVLEPHEVLVLGERLWGRALPSGHAASAFALVGVLLADPLWQRAQRLRALALALLFAVAMAWSRVAVGAHWPTDVLAGAVLGVCVGQASWGLRSTRWLARVLVMPGARRWAAGLWLLLAMGLAVDAGDLATDFGLWLASAAGLAAAWRCWRPPQMLAWSGANV